MSEATPGTRDMTGYMADTDQGHCRDLGHPDFYMKCKLRKTETEKRSF